MRFAHILTQNKTTPLPRNFIFVDTETNSITEGDYTHHHLKLGAACFVRAWRNREKPSESWLSFTDNNEFWGEVDWFVDEKQKVLLYAHNMHFDFFVLDGIKHLQKLGWKLGSFFINSNVFIMVWKKRGKKLVILDSGNILKVKLEKIGELLKLPKGVVNFDTVSFEDLKVYCKRDVRILKEWILSFRNFVEKHDLGVYKHTIASQAFQAFRHRFMKHEIYIHNCEPAIELERDSYFGGRTEAFFLGKIINRRFFLVDVNSMYPFVMRKEEYPTKLTKFTRKATIQEMKKWLETHAVIAEVELEVSKPAFPYRDKRTIFPTGSFKTTLCTPELKTALREGSIKKIVKMCVYETAPIFQNYVNYFYDLKLDYKARDSPLMYAITKLFLNSLYGKFGQKAKIMERQGKAPENVNLIEDVYDFETKRFYVHYMLAGQEWRQKGETESFNSFAAISAHVTSYARSYLWDLMNCAGMENIYYCDTDSLLVNQDGMKHIKYLLHPTELGKLDIQDHVDNIDIRGVKDYTFGDKTRIKGIRKDATQKSVNEYIQDQFLKFRSILRLGDSGGAVVKRVKKELSRKYQKGIVLDSGRIRPYRLPDDLTLLTSS